MHYLYFYLYYFVDFILWYLISLAFWIPLKWVVNKIIFLENKNENINLKKIETNSYYLGMWCVLSLKHVKAFLSNLTT